MTQFRSSGGPLVSVIIPTRNRAADISRVLGGIEGQDFPRQRFEIIVVDNGSTDGTREVLEHFRGRLENLVTSRDERPGLHVGRNRGLELARGPVLLLGDDDIVPSPTWVRAVSEAFGDKTVGLVTGPVRPKFDVQPPAWFKNLVVDIPGGWYVGEYSLIELGSKMRAISPNFVFGCNFGVRRSLVDEAGGFPPDALPRELLRFRGDGETAVAQAISQMGFKSVYVPKAEVFHRVASERLDLRYVERRAFMEGVTASYRAIRASGASSARGSMAHLRARLSALRSSIGQPKAVRCRHRGWVAGYLWHQAEATRDQALLEWILLEDYRGAMGDLLGHLTEDS